MRQALLDFYKDLIEMIKDRQGLLEDKETVDADSKLYKTQKLVYREILEGLEKTRDMIRDFD